MKHQTKLPETLKSIAWEHSHGIIKVVKWLENLGIKLYHKTHVIETTSFDIHIRHANDYVDMGPAFEDPDGNMFHCYTSQMVEFNVPYEIITKVMAAIRDHQSIGSHRIADNIEIDTDVENQFIMKNHMMADDWNWEKCSMNIEFRVYHNLSDIS